MLKIWIICLLVITSSFFLVKQTDQTNFFTHQSGYDDEDTLAYFHGHQTTTPSFLALSPPSPKVLGDSNETKNIYVDLTNQRLYAYEGDRLVYSFLVSTGKWGRTPTGTFSIWAKYRFIKMSGGSTALRTYYYLPNVPYTMFFSNDSVPASKGFALHGTYWHDNFGHPMSHGCVNMKTPEAGIIYNWSDPVIPEGKSSTNSNKNNPGTKIIIYGVTPQS